MSDARNILERLLGAGPAPVEAPPKPGIAPGPMRPARPEPQRPGRPDPFRRKDLRPGEKTRPKAAYGMDTTYSEAEQFLKANGLGEFLGE